MPNFVVIVSILTVYMTKFEAMTPFPHEVWSPASSASLGIRTYDPHTRGRALSPLGYTQCLTTRLYTMPNVLEQNV